MNAPSLHILLIDDDSADARVVEELLARATRVRFVLECTSDLSAGLAVLARGETDAVLFSLSADPENDSETLVALRSKFPAIPVVLLISRKDQARAAGLMPDLAQDYLIKEELEAGLLEQALQNRVRRVMNQTSSGSTAEKKPNSTSSLLDWSAALSAVDGDRQLLKEVIEAFLEECPRMLEECEQAITNSDARVVRRTAHTIRGGLRTFGAGPATEVASRLEEMGRTGELSGCDEVLAALKLQLDQLLPELSAFAFRGGMPPLQIERPVSDNRLP